MNDDIIKRETEKQKLLDDLGNIMGFETVYARSVRILNKIFEDLEKEIEKEDQNHESLEVKQDNFQESINTK